MKPIPADVAARWSPMWATDHHPERPWWHKYSPAVYSRHHWRRCDGLRGPRCDDPDDPEADIPGDTLAAIDAANPLPAPPPMPGQVWVAPTGDEFTIAAIVKACVLFATLAPSPEAYGAFAPCVSSQPEWPAAGAILVAGPTPWGRDVPWSAP